MFRTTQRYTLAIALAVFALVVQQLLDPYVHHNVSYILLFPAVMAAAWVCGAGPGIACLFICGTASVWFWSPQRLELDVFDDQLALALYATLSVGLIWMVQRGRRNFERFRGAFENAASGVVQANQTDHLIAANDRLCQMLGYAREELLGRTLRELMHPDDRTRSDDLFAQLRDGRLEMFQCEQRYQKRDGAPLWVHVAYSAVRDDARHFRYSVGTVLDISARKAAEAQVRLLAAAIEAAPNAISLSETDPEGTIVWVNPAFTKLTGYSADEAIGQTHHFLSSGQQDEDFYRRLWETIGRGEVWRGELTNRRKDGSLYHEEMGITSLRDDEGKITHFLAVKQDISARKQAEAALRESEKRFAAFMAHLPAAAWIKDLRGRYVYTNAEGERIFSVASAELLGRTDDELFPPDTARHFRENDQRALAKADGLRTTETLRQADGQAHHSIVQKFVIPSSEGTPAYIGGVAFDITDRKRAEDQLKLQATALEAAANGILITAPDGTIRWANPAFSSMTGYSFEEAVGQTPRILKSGKQDAAFYRKMWEIIARGEVWRGELINRRKDGTLYTEEMTIAPVFDGDEHIVSYIAIKQDITARKRAEQALSEAEERLQEEARRKDDFLAVLGHELRNPLGPIRNAVHLMNRLGLQEPALQRTRTIIDRQVTLMARLLDDLLDVSRIKRGKVLLKKELLNLAEVVRVAAEDHRAELEASGITLEIHVPQSLIHVNADRARVTQIVGNLLHNACNFTDRGGRVWVQVCASQSHNQALFTVRDTGAGMDLNLLECAFEPFMQAERSMARTPGGLGLGLALVKGFVELHGGSVQVQSAGLGQGTEFIIVLPMERDALSRPAGEEAGREPRSRRVLIVEDNRDAAESLRMLLQISGHQTEEAHDASEGLDKARQFAPEIILCDIGLPGEMDGYAFARTVRQDSALVGIFLVALTGYGTEKDRQRAQDAGFDLHLTKPVDPGRLERVVGDFPLREPSSPAANAN